MAKHKNLTAWDMAMLEKLVTARIAQGVKNAEDDAFVLSLRGLLSDLENANSIRLVK
jgi:hypothetical protein